VTTHEVGTKAERRQNEVSPKPGNGFSPLASNFLLPLFCFNALLQAHGINLKQQRIHQCFVPE
jgi:hypothetical protein